MQRHPRHNFRAEVDDQERCHQVMHGASQKDGDHVRGQAHFEDARSEGEHFEWKWRRHGGRHQTANQ